MRSIKTKFITGLALLLMAVGIALASTPAVRPADNNPPLELPSPICDSLQVPVGNVLAFRMYARGVQIYRWNGSSWQFVAPSATLLSLFVSP